MKLARDREKWNQGKEAENADSSGMKKDDDDKFGSAL